MDFNKLVKATTVFIFSVCFFIGCADKEKINTNNTYYFDLVNFTKDSLKQSITKNLAGKASFYKNEKLEILSLNYITEDYPDMHYFISATTLINTIEPGTQKIEIKFEGEYSVDSITYSLSKYVYKDKQWVNTASMNLIKATTTYKKAKEFAIPEFAKQITNSTVLYTYN